MTRILSTTTKNRMHGVHPKLLKLIPGALARCAVDFGCTEDQVRTPAEQALKVKQGYSKTLNGPHVQKADGFGHAIDLVPFIDGKFQWGDNQWRVKTADGHTLEPFYDIAAAMQEEAILQHVRIKWGAVWDRCLNDLPRGALALREAMKEYCVRHPGKDFIDGPHFELM